MFSPPASCTPLVFFISLCSLFPLYVVGGMLVVSFICTYMWFWPGFSLLGVGLGLMLWCYGFWQRLGLLGGWPGPSAGVFMYILSVFGRCFLY